MAWGTLLQSAFLTVDANYEFLEDGTDAIVLALNPREGGSVVFHYDAAGTTDDLEIQVLQGHRISTGNGLDGATAADDLELDTAADGFTTDDDMNGTYIIMTSGGEQGEGRQISDSVAADDGVNLTHALSGVPSAAETYDLYKFGYAVEMTLSPAALTSSDDDPLHSKPISFDARNGQYIAFRARASGATDAHRVRASYQVDGVAV